MWSLFGPTGRQFTQPIEEIDRSIGHANTAPITNARASNLHFSLLPFPLTLQTLVLASH